MFTGLIERTGQLASIEHRGEGRLLTVRYEPWKDDPLVAGESIAVQGVCLTVTDCSRPGCFRCDVLAETLATANLGGKKPGALLNLERATRPGERLGGHILSGHVDAVGKLEEIRRSAEDRVLRIACGAEVAGGTVLKGSIAVDGISLTVTNLTDDWFEVHIIPHTWRHTSLCERKLGDTVNLETDLIGKYVARYLSESRGKSTVTVEDLVRAGFA